MNEVPPEKWDKIVAIEDQLESQAHIILSELKAARRLVQKLGHCPNDITKPYLDLVSKHYLHR